MSKPSAKNRSSTSSGKQQLAGDDTKEPGHPGDAPLKTDKRGQTIPSRGEERVPRLPHERDESVDSQAGNADELPSSEQSRQAFDDVERGLVNTDRGLEGNTILKNASSTGTGKRDNKPI